MSTAAVFLDIEKAFDTTWYPGLLYKLHKLKISTDIIADPTFDYCLVGYFVGCWIVSSVG
jgi:hypothetical protein